MNGTQPSIKSWTVNWPISLACCCIKTLIIQPGKWLQKSSRLEQSLYESGGEKSL